MPARALATRPGGTRRVAPLGGSIRFDPAVRPAAIALVVGVLVLVAGNSLDDAAFVTPTWGVGLVLLVVAAWSANRARYRITTHPDQRKGLAVVVPVLVLSLLGIAGLGTATWVAARSAPAADAPLGLGGLHSVERMRWGIQRLSGIIDTGWERPAKDAGTCWEGPDAGDEPRREERVELGGARVSCAAPHAYEVLGAYAVDRDADSPYPGAGALAMTALARCEAAQEAIEDPPAGLTYDAEYPTAAGWANGDHDVTCVAVLERTGALG